MKVLVAHPTRQHSHRLAWALNDAGMLNGFLTLLPDRRSLGWLPGWLDTMLPSAVFRHSLQFLPKEMVRVLLGPLYFQKLSSALDSAALRQTGELAAWRCFDRWVAHRLPHSRAKVVVGYEMCCLETFRVAQSLGIYCVLDAASCHHRWSDQQVPEHVHGAETWAGRRLRARKDREVSLADHILCVSALAKESYTAAGVAAERITVNPVGCDTRLFRLKRSTDKRGPPVFLFVGIPVYRKGFDLLVSAFSRLAADCPGAELLVVGQQELACVAVAAEAPIRFLGKLSQTEINDVLATVDCLVLPSRVESFGMVVIEALAAGVPVIVSDHVGAAQAVMPDRNGWVVRAGDPDALLERLHSCCQQIESVRAMRDACVPSAHPFDWSGYARRTVDFFSGIA